MDIALHACTHSPWYTSVRESLTSLVEEAKGRCSAVGRRMGEEREGQFSKHETIAELRDESDWRITRVAEYSTCNV